MNYYSIKVCRIFLIAFVVLQTFYTLIPVVSAQDKDLPEYSRDKDTFELIPKVEDQVLKDTYKELSSNKTKHQFWDIYGAKANKLKLNDQLATWVMNWDTIIAYAGVVIQFISSLWLVVWAWFIIYSGYQYAMSAFGTQEDKGKAIKNAFIGIAIITTSYGIFRLLYRIFIE